MYKEKHTLKNHYSRHKLSRYVDVYETSTINCSANKLTGYAGDNVTVTSTPAWNQKFSSYSITGSTLTGSDFMFVNSDVTVEANYETAKNLTLQTDGHGTIAASRMSGFIGDQVTLSNTPNAGFIFNDYSITGATLTGSTFNFVGNNVTANANFTMTSFVPTGSMGKYYDDDKNTHEVSNLSASGSSLTMINGHIQDVFNWPATAHYAAATYMLKTESMPHFTERIGGGYIVAESTSSSPSIGPSANVIVSSVIAPKSGAIFGPTRLGIIIDVANSALSSFVNRNFNFTENNIPSPPAFLATNCSGNSVIMSGVTMRTFGSYDDAYNFIQLWQ